MTSKLTRKSRWHLFFLVEWGVVGGGSLDDEASWQTNEVGWWESPCSFASCDIKMVLDHPSIEIVEHIHGGIFMDFCFVRVWLGWVVRNLAGEFRDWLFRRNFTWSYSKHVRCGRLECLFVGLFVFGLSWDLSHLSDGPPFAKYRTHLCSDC